MSTLVHATAKTQTASARERYGRGPRKIARERVLAGIDPVLRLMMVIRSRRCAGSAQRIIPKPVPRPTEELQTPANCVNRLCECPSPATASRYQHEGMRSVDRLIVPAALPALALWSCAGPQVPTGPAPGADGSNVRPAEAAPDWARGTASRPFRRAAAPDPAKRGIYVSSFDGTSIYGFKNSYVQGSGPICTLYTGQVYVNGIAADSLGNLIVPQNNGNLVKIYRGPDMCGPLLGSLKDPYGQPANAASFNAATGTIVVADIEGKRGTLGSLAVCSLGSGCTRRLEPKFTGYATGVALAKNGDCWLTTENRTFTAAGMTYGRTAAGRAN